MALSPRRGPRLRVRLLCLLACLGSSPGLAQAEPSSEYQLKAVFLFNFAQFVTWPPSAFADSAAPLVIGVVGDDPFGGFLDETVRGESVNGHPLEIRRFQAGDELTGCHILFISRGEDRRLPSILAGLKGSHVLTVADMDHFARRGGMIRFVTERNRIRLRINLEAARSADLTISSKLLRPSEIVRSRED